MPLSDREQQILQEIERDLLSDNPELIDLERHDAPRRDQLKAGALIFVIGLVALVGFFATSLIVVGLGAFAAMVGGLVLMIAGVKDVVGKNFRELDARERVNELFSGWEKHFKNRRDGS